LRLWRNNASKAFRNEQVWLGFVIYLLIAVGGGIASAQIHPWIPFGYIVYGCIFAIGFLVFLQFWVGAVRVYLKQERERADSRKSDC
jgi:hypothetical protein